MHFRFRAAIFDFSLPVTFDSTDNMEMSSELNDLGNLGVDIDISNVRKSMYTVLPI